MSIEKRASLLSPIFGTDHMNAVPVARILIVDDEAANMRSLCDTLGDHGYETEGFTAGAAALDALRERQFDLLLTDLVMPDMDGVALLGAAMQIDPHLAGILMTGKGTIETAVQAMQAGALDYVLKPIKMGAILPVLARAVNVRRLRLENLELRNSVAIHELNQAIAHTLDPNVLLDKIAGAALAQFEADEASVMLLSEDGKSLFVAAVRGDQRDTLLGTRVPLGTGIAGQVAASREPLVLQGEVKDPRTLPLHPRPGIQSALSMPMITRNKLIGVLNVNYTQQQRAIPPGQIRVLSIFVNAAAAGIEAARLHEEQRKADTRHRAVLLRAQEELRINEQRYRALVETTLVLPWEFDLAEWRFTYVAPLAEKVFGYTREEWLVSGFWERLIHPDDRDHAVRYSREQILAKKDHVLEYRTIAADGRCIWVRDLISVVMDEDNAGKLRGVFVDITVAKQAELELRRFEEMVATTTDLMTLRGADGRYLVVNDQYCRYFNLAREQIIGRTPAGLFGHEQYEQVIGPCSERCLRGETVRAESWIDYPGTGRRYMDLHYHPFLDAGGGVAGIVVSARDITERKQAELELQVRLEQQAALARFSAFALIRRDFGALLRQAVELCAQVLDVEYCKVLEIVPGTGTLLLRSGVGWRDGLVGTAIVGTEMDSQAGYTLKSRSQVIVADLRTEKRFSGPELLRSHGVVSGMSVIIGEPHDPFGVLGVHTQRSRQFTPDDAAFLQSVANTLAGAILRNRAESTLAAAEQRFSLLLNSSPSVIYATEVSGNYHCNFVSSAVQDVVGYQPQVMLSDPAFWINQVHPDDIARVVIQIKTALDDGGGTNEYRFRHKDGRYRWIRDTFKVLLDAAGEPAEVVGTWTDVTERVRMESELRASEARFRLTAQATNDLIHEWDMETGKIEWFGAAAATLGYTEEELPGTEADWWSAVHPDDLERIKTAWVIHSKDNSHPFSEEYRIRIGKLGYRIWVAGGSFIESAGGQSRRWIGACTDVTDARQLKERLFQSQKMEAIGQLTGGVAHDFNNRLTVILGNLELLERRLADQDARRLVQSALAAAEGGAELTRQLLTLSRKQVLEKKVFDVNALLAQSTDLLVRTLGETITVKTVCAGRACLVESDRAQLENIILNLVINARHAMPEGGQLTIETAIVAIDQTYIKAHAHARVGDYVMIAVTDTGAGMSEEVKQHAFEPYFTTKPQGQGTGLGLAMVYGFIKQSEGHIEIYSEIGHGTSVKIYLPRRARAMEAGTAAPSAARQERPDLLRGYAVLLVEDETPVREIATEILRSLECELLIASNAAEAITLFDKHPAIDLLFTDLVMPGSMGGVELAVALRKRRRELKVLYTSGYAPQAVNGRFQVDGPNDFWIAKPYRPLALRQTVRDALLRQG